MEGTFWRQRAKLKSIALGDKNTAYFHQLATQQHKHKYILGLNNQQGQFVTSKEGIGKIIKDHFAALFQSSNPTQLERITDLVQPRLTTNDESQLSSPFIVGEFYAAVQSMEASKAPGPDGYPPLFYQRFWTTIGHDICSLILAFLNDGVLFSV